MAGTLAPNAVFTGFDNNGIIMPGGLLYTYTAGTTTPATTWTDSALSVPNANPIVLDSAGRAVIYLNPGASYKFLLKTAASVTVWTQDNIAAIPGITNVDISGVAGETVTAGQAVYLSLGDGSRTVGTWYKTFGFVSSPQQYKNVAAGRVGFVILAGTVGQAITVRTEGIVTGLSSLSIGSVYYTDTATAGSISINVGGLYSRALGIADTATSLVIIANNQQFGLPYHNETPHYIIGHSGQPATPVEAVVDGTLASSLDSNDRANITTGETALSSFTVYGNTFNSLIKGNLKVSFSWTMAANGNTKTVKFYFGGTPVTVYTGAQNGGTGHAEMWVTRVNNTSQKITGFMTAVNAAGTGTSASFSTTAAETMSGDILVKTTGTSATSSNDIIQNMFIPQVSGL